MDSNTCWAERNVLLPLRVKRRELCLDRSDNVSESSSPRVGSFAPRIVLEGRQEATGVGGRRRTGRRH